MTFKTDSNVPIPVSVAFHGFGGWKRSLLGSHHIYGSGSVHFYTRSKAVKTTSSRWPIGTKAGASLVSPTMEASLSIRNHIHTHY